MTGAPTDKFIQTISPLLHLWQSVRVSGMALNIEGQWLSIGIRVELCEDPPSRRDISSPDPPFLYYVVDHPLESLSDLVGKLIGDGSYLLEANQQGGGAFARISLRRNPANPSVPASPISWYAPQRRESKSPGHAGEAQRSAVVIGAFGERFDSVLDYESRQELDTKLRQADPGYDGVRGLAQELFPGSRFENWDQTFAEIVADLPFEIEFIDAARLVVRASPRISDGAFTARCFYEPGTAAKPPRVVFRKADATATEAGALQWEHFLSWPTNSKSVTVTLFYHQVEIQSIQLNRATLRRATLAKTLQSQYEERAAVAAQPPGRSPKEAESVHASRRQEASTNKSRRVFVVHGRDERLRVAMFTFLRAMGLEPLEWTKAMQLTGKASPYIGEILDAAFKHAQAAVVLLTPDDEARLREDFLLPDDPSYEKMLTGQARANVLFEAGMAFASHPEQTVLVQFGQIRPFSDVAGRHIVKMDNSPQKRQELALKLRTAGCSVDIVGTDWQTVGDLTPPTGAIGPAPSPGSNILPAAKSLAAESKLSKHQRVFIAPVSRSTSDKEYTLDKVDETGVVIRLPNGVLVRIPRSDYIESWDDTMEKPKLILTRKYFQGYFPGHENAEEYFLPR